MDVYNTGFNKIIISICISINNFKEIFDEKIQNFYRLSTVAYQIFGHRRYLSASPANFTSFSSPATGVSSSQLIKRPGPRVHILVTSPLLTSIRVSYGLSLEYVSAAICGSALHRLSYQLSIYHRETTTLYNIPAALSSQLN